MAYKLESFLEMKSTIKVMIMLILKRSVKNWLAEQIS